jgi:hypothetical protein
MTRTHVIYFGDEDLEEIAAGFRRLETSFLERKPAMSTQTSRAYERRLDVLRCAWALLLEPVPESFL